MNNAGVRTYRITLTGKTPLLMHADNLDWADQMERWKNNPESKKVSKAGDDRTPAFRWIGCLYHDGSVIALPGDNLMRCLMEGGAMVPVPGGKNGKTFKAQTQSGCMVGEAYWPLQVGSGGTIPLERVMKLTEEPSFAQHQSAAAELGFMLYVKRAKIGQSKHVRVRPRFDQWTVTGTLNVWDEQLTQDALVSILHYAGRYKGLGDWRPGGKTPGPHGMFDAAMQLL